MRILKYFKPFIRQNLVSWTSIEKNLQRNTYGGIHKLRKQDFANF